LGDAGFISYGLALCLDVQPHLWNDHGGEADIHEGLVGEEEYLGMCRWKSEILVRMMTRLPSTVTIYMDRNSPKRMGSKLGFSVIPRRINSGILVALLGSMCLMCLTKIRDRKKNCDTTIQYLPDYIFGKDVNCICSSIRESRI
jgi:hypothetical protein